MNASKRIEEGFLIMKTILISMLLGFMVSVTAPAFGVTEPSLTLQEAEAAAVAEAEGEDPGMFRKGWGWVVGKKTAVVTGVTTGIQDWRDPEKINVALQAQKKIYLQRIKELEDAAAVKQVGSEVEIDALKGCAVDLTAFLETLKPE